MRFFFSLSYASVHSRAARTATPRSSQRRTRRCAGRKEFARAVKASQRTKDSLSPALLDAMWAVLDKSGDEMVEFQDFFGALKCRGSTGTGPPKIGEFCTCCRRCAVQALFPAL